MIQNERKSNSFDELTLIKDLNFHGVNIDLNWKDNEIEVS